MKKPIIILLAGIILLPSIIKAQTQPGRLKFTLFSGLGSFNMDQLKKLNTEQEGRLLFNIKYVDNFDPALYYGGSLEVCIKSVFNLGINYQYYTTGSRIGQKDYSGYYAFDQILSGHFIGIKPGFNIIKRDFFIISASIQVGELLSNMRLVEDSKLWEESYHESYTFSARSFSTFPSVEISAPLYKFLGSSLSIGKMFDAGGKIHLSDDEETILMVDGTQVRTGWSGWRISLSMYMRLIK